MQIFVNLIFMIRVFLNMCDDKVFTWSRAGTYKSKVARYMGCYVIVWAECH